VLFDMATVVPPRATVTRRRVLAVVVAVIVVVATTLGVLLARGGGDKGSEPPAAPETSATAPAVLPLLGTSGRVPERAALAVKIDDTEHGRPPTGLTRADVVFEEVVEGGLTRLLAVYQSQDPDTVGPVRSARSTDLSFLAELGRTLFAWSGANPTFAAAVEAADIVDVGMRAAPDAYRRASDRPAPYNLYAAPDELRRAAAAADEVAASTPPPQLFSYRAADAPLSGPGVEAATGFRTAGTGAFSTDIEWSWEPGSATWTRRQNGTPHVDSDGEPVRAINVIVRITPYRDSGVRDSVGAVVPEAQAVGGGDAWLLSGGRVQPGRWHKPSADAPTTYTDAAGAPLRLAPGPTWVEVLPPGTGEVETTRSPTP
jgi:Protein of unknown function (DUF3048) N-terminal domain/Protein of unknown function (DUF3048) C-terminal domain